MAEEMKKTQQDEEVNTLTNDAEKATLDDSRVNADENLSTDDDVVFIHKKERNPIVKFLIGFVIFVVSAFIVLFAVGFMMGLMGKEVPTLDSQVLQNKWEDVTGGESEPTEPPSELEPAE